MQLIDAGGPAFPEPERYGRNGERWTEDHGYRRPGMTLLDYLAGQALQGLLAHQGCPRDRDEYRERAKAAYTIAEEMLSVRENLP